MFLDSIDFIIGAIPWMLYAILIVFVLCVIGAIIEVCIPGGWSRINPPYDVNRHVMKPLEGTQWVQLQDVPEQLATYATDHPNRNGNTLIPFDVACSKYTHCLIVYDNNCNCKFYYLTDV